MDYLPVSLLLAEPQPNVFGIARTHGSSLLKPSPRPSKPAPVARMEPHLNQKLEDSLAVESLVRQITEWDTSCNE
jgi:hypothetical protein